MNTFKFAFPSPCGEKVGINCPLVDLDSRVDFDVSVPLRGKGRDQQYYYSRYSKANFVECFRPLAGKR